MSSRGCTVEFDARRIDALFADLDQGSLPGAVVGIALGGKPIYRRAFGLASMELPVPLSCSMRMRIYSITKHFTCLAYMLLCEAEAAGIDDPIGKYIPELREVMHPVTMRQLMGHTGGIRDVHDICLQFSGTGHPVSTAELLLLYCQFDDVNFASGSHWCYCNGGYLLLTVAIERITRQPLEEVLRARIFEPTGMRNTLLRRFDTDFVPNSATMHTMSVAGRYEKSYLGTASAGEGGIVSTVDDLLRWLAHMDAPRIGSPATWATMKAPQRLLNGTCTGYGLGLVTGHHRGVQTLHHAGGGMGANSQMLKVPAAGLDVVVIVNRDDVSSLELTDRILDACLPGLEPVQSSANIPIATGVFRSPVTGRVIQLARSAGDYSSHGPRQQVLIDGTDTPLEIRTRQSHGPPPRFSSPQRLTLHGDPARPESIQLEDFGHLDELCAVEANGALEGDRLLGRFRAASIDTEVLIQRSERGLRLVSFGRFGSMIYELECLGARVWQMRSKSVPFLGGILSFDLSHRAFHFSSYRTWALSFSRCA